MKFRNLLLIAAALLFCGTLSQAQSIVPSTCRDGSTFFSSCYGRWTAQVDIGTTATGSGTVTLYFPTVTLPDGGKIVPFATNVPITIGVGSNAETVTPSAVGSGCVVGNVQDSCTLTATFANIHGHGDLVQSGDNGYAEALNDAAANGGGQVYFKNDTGILALSTGGTTTDTASASFVPANSIILGAVGRVTTTISGGTCTAWGFGTATTATKFTPTTIALTAGTLSTSVTPGFLGANIASATTGILQVSADKLRVTCATGAPGAGAVHVVIWGYTFVPPAS